MLRAIADGESNPTALADLADPSLRATREQLSDALSACQELDPVYRELIKMALEELQLLEQQMGQLDQKMATLLTRYQDQVERLAEVPGLGADSAQQIIAEVGASAASFPSAGALASGVGACPGPEETAGVNRSHRSPKGNRQMRRLLNLAAHASIKHPGTIFAILYRRYVTRLGPNQTIAVLAHRLCRLIWKILYQGVRYEERGPAINEKTRRRRTARMIRELRQLGYRIEVTGSPSPVPA